MVGFLIAILSGVCMSIQGVFNTGVTKVSGTWAASAFVQALALGTCLVAWGIWEREPLWNVFRVEPKYMLLGGAIGAVITYTVIKSMEAMGPARAVMVIVVSQITMAYLIEVFGWWNVEKQPFSWLKLFGILLAVSGVLCTKFS